ncbi:hypothetical protein GWI33_006609 [Rhynchophorus ferrugineus]|uniref:Uncharacterized protein n=1 Tax=Rhynchophorus ferrugineus TaxID=354439 RepID=A0A834IFJ6_RHYFE|nr:hypothetical protein GWI33_006609 [Rhynchophorus ferrugineus]
MDFMNKNPTQTRKVHEKRDCYNPTDNSTPSDDVYPYINLPECGKLLTGVARKPPRVVAGVALPGPAGLTQYNIVDPLNQFRLGIRRRSWGIDRRWRCYRSAPKASIANTAKISTSISRKATKPMAVGEICTCRTERGARQRNVHRTSSNYEHDRWEGHGTDFVRYAVLQLSKLNTAGVKGRKDRVRSQYHNLSTNSTINKAQDEKKKLNQ